MAVAIDATGGAVDAAGATRGALGTTGAREGTREQAIRRPLAAGRQRAWPAGRITLELTRNQVRVAPEYKRGEPLVVLGPERTTPSTEAATPEK
jgi:hypothetical protein